VKPLSFADSLRERRDLAARHPDRNPYHKRSGLKPCLSAVVVNEPHTRSNSMSKPIVAIVYYGNPLALTLKAVKLFRGLGHRPY